MIAIDEYEAVTQRFTRGSAIVTTFGEDQEEWCGIRSQFIAIILGWA
jgi:hypothetical protein